jgi:hypothetical protein
MLELAKPVRSLRGKIILEIGDLFFFKSQCSIVIRNDNPLSASASTASIRLFPNPLDYAKSRVH